MIYNEITDYRQHNDQVIESLLTAVETLGPLYDFIKGSPWSDELATMIIRLNEMREIKMSEGQAIDGIIEGRKAVRYVHKYDDIDAHTFNPGTAR